MTSRLPARRSTRTAEARAQRAEIMADVYHGDLQEAQRALESTTRLELALEDAGWDQLLAHADTEFTRHGIERIAAVSKLMWRKNPLIQRAVNVKTYYTWSGGVTIKARDEQVAEDVVRPLMDSPANIAAWWGHDARETNDRELSLSANLPVILVTSKTTGAVEIRTRQWTEFADPVRNPEDRDDVWFWPRRWWTPDGQLNEVLHPDVDHLPTGVRPQRHNGLVVRWDQPVLMATTNRLSGETWGVSEVYAAIDWARAYKDFLEDWATYVKALADFAWRHKTDTAKAARRVRATHQAAADGNPDAYGRARTPGATAVGTDVDGLEPIKHSGAHVDAESGRPLALMVSSATDVPYAILTGDADKSNLAAQTALDVPLERSLTSRRRRWADLDRRIINYAIDQSVRAPRGKLPGTTERDDWGRIRVVTPESLDRTVDVDWPPLVEHSLEETMKAIGLAADKVAGLPPDVLLRLTLTAFGVDDVDDIVNDAVFAAAQADTQADAEGAAAGVVEEALREALAGAVPA